MEFIPTSRRDLLRNAGAGFGALALHGLLGAEGAQAAQATSSPLAPKAPHFPARAKRVIFLFMSGGPSHVDTFDPKPRLRAENGKPLPFAKPKLERTATGNLLGSPWEFKRAGKCGMEVSELFPHFAGIADDVTLIRSMLTDNINHNGACLQMNTGEQAFSRPSLGSWATYGLGTVNANLPGFVVLSPAQPAQGAPLWGASFLPASHQGTLVTDLNNPIANLRSRGVTTARQRAALDAINALNSDHMKARPDDARLAARIESFELAYRMQQEAPDAFDVSRESAETKKMYGLDEPMTETFGKQCLMARRLVERGVRFVQVYHTATSKRSSCQLWDQHGGLRGELPNNCASIDKPIAGLIKDLKARGLLEDTLVVWGGEFGRTPTTEGGGDGREHHPFGFSMWMAGGGAKRGYVHGATDEYGWHAQKDIVHVHDLHATILHMMGLDHTRLTYRFGGRDYRLTDVYGNVVKDLLA